MSITAEKELRKLRTLWISLEDGSLRMTWAEGTLLAGWNYMNVKERLYGR
jgi:hypothetical protein